MITDETRRELEEIYEEMESEGDGPGPAFKDLLPQRDRHDWMKDALREADQFEAGFGTRYSEVPRAESRDGYRDMEEFINTVQNERLQARLRDAIRGRGAFRRFKDVILDYPVERERGFALRDARARQRILE